MKKIPTSTKIFALLGILVIITVVVQIIAANRMLNDRRLWRGAESTEALKTALETRSKTYRKVQAGPFSKIIVKNGVNVQIIKSDSYSVYRSNYNRARIEISEEAGVLYISDKNDYFQFGDTPVFVLMPEEPDVCFTSGLSMRNEISGFDGHRTKVSIDSADICLQTNLKHLNIAVRNGNLKLRTGSRYSSPAAHTDITIRAEQSEITFLDSLSKSVDIQMNLNKSMCDVFVHEQALIGKIKLTGNLAPYLRQYGLKENITLLTQIDSRAICDSLLVNLRVPEDKRYEFVVSEGLQVQYEEVNVTGRVDVMRREIERRRTFWPND